MGSARRLTVLDRLLLAIPRQDAGFLIRPPRLIGTRRCHVRAPDLSNVSLGDVLASIGSFLFHQRQFLVSRRLTEIRGHKGVSTAGFHVAFPFASVAFNVSSSDASAAVTLRHVTVDPGRGRRHLAMARHHSGVDHHACIRLAHRGAIGLPATRGQRASDDRGRPGPVPWQANAVPPA